MERFSDRVGQTVRPSLARDGMSHELRVSLWNVFQPALFHTRSNQYVPREGLTPVYRFLHWPTSSLSHYDQHEIEKLENWFFSRDREWYEIYNFIEFVSQMGDGRNVEWYSDRFNPIL